MPFTRNEYHFGVAEECHFPKFYIFGIFSYSSRMIKVPESTMRTSSAYTHNQNTPTPIAQLV